MKTGAVGVALALLMAAGAGCKVPAGKCTGPPAQGAAFELQGTAAMTAGPQRPGQWPVPAPPLGAPYGMRPGMPSASPGVDAILLHRWELGLSAQQVDALMKLRLNAGLSGADLNARREQAWLQLDAALSEKKVDLEAVRNLVHAIAETEAEMYYAGIVASVQAEDLLSPDQLARLDQVEAAPTWRVVPPLPAAPPGVMASPPATAPPGVAAPGPLPVAPPAGRPAPNLPPPPVPLNPGATGAPGMPPAPPAPMR